MFSKTILFSVVAGVLCAQEPQNPPTSKDRRAGDPGAQQSAQDSDKNKSSMSKDSALSSTDRNFLNKVAMNGHKEVEMAKMAVDRASSPEVKNLAQRLVDDHTKVNEDVSQLAKEKGVSLSVDPSMTSKSSDSDAGAAQPSTSRADQSSAASGSHTATGKESRQLANLSGDKFDRAFLKTMKSSHEKSISSFEKYSRSGTDSEIKAFAEKTLPALKAHLDQIKTVQSSMGTKSNTPKTSSE